MTLNGYWHTPVLVEEVLHGLNVQAQGCYVDCTYGRGGHSLAILARLGNAGRLLVMDRDLDAVAWARKQHGTDARVTVVHAPFSLLQRQCEQLGWDGAVDGVLFDLGMSSDQLADASRGFSFQHAGALDMRFDRTAGITAAEWLQQAPEQDIATVLRDFGEERYARRIAAAIVRMRSVEPLVSTEQLRRVIVGAVPSRERNKDPATRTFQALRIHTNDELNELYSALPQAVTVLKPGGRLAVISFHSLEDRIVKRFMRVQASGDRWPRDLPVTAGQMKPSLKLIGKALRARDSEVESNRRARSAVLRIAERCAA